MNRRIPTSLPLLALVLGAVSACTSGTPPAPTPSATTTPTVTAAPPTKQPAGAFAELSDVECARSGGAWSFSATVTNEGTSAVTYTVTASIAKKDGGTVVASKRIRTTVEGGESEKIRAEAFSRTTAKDVSCITSATKGSGSS